MAATAGTSPWITFLLTSGGTSVPNADQKLLFVGQKLPDGSAVNKELVQNVQAGQEDTLFGVNSILSQMLKVAREYNEVNRFDAIALDDNAGGTEATATIQFTGTATENKDLIIQVGNKTFEYATTIASGTSNTDIATQFNAEVAAETTYPYTGAVVTDTVTLTYDHKGTAGDELQIKVISKPAGVTVTVVDFTGGAGVVDVDGIFDNLTERYQTIIYSQDLDLEEATDFTEGRFDVNNEVLDGSVIIFKDGDLSSFQTFLGNRNERTLIVGGNIDESSAFELTTNLSAYTGALKALRLSDSAIIRPYVLNAFEALGGTDKASLPYHNTPLFLVDGLDGRITQQQQENIVDAGGFIFIENPAGQVVFGQMPTTYKTNILGVQDLTWKFQNYIDTATSAREYYFNNAKLRFGQTRATEGGLVPKRAIENVSSVTAWFVQQYRILGEFMLVPLGAESEEFFKENLDVTLDNATGTFSVNMKLPIVTQFRQLDVIAAVGFNFEF